MSKPRIKESLVFKKDIVLKSTAEKQLEEHEYLFSKTTFNEEGKKLSEKQFDSQGNLIQEYVYEYDPNGFLTLELMREGDDFVVEKKTFLPDEKGRIQKEYRHYMDESYDTVNYHYNHEGLLIKKEVYDPDNELENIEEYEYEGKNLIRFVLKDADEDILSEKRMKYDSSGNILELTEYDESEDTTIKKVYGYYPGGSKKEVLTYNEAGKLVEHVYLKEDNKGKVVQLIEETAHKKNTTNFSYDDKGNITNQEEFDKKGETVSRVNRKYNEHNILESSEVFIDGGGRGVSRNYTMRQEYIFY